MKKYGPEDEYNFCFQLPAEFQSRLEVEGYEEDATSDWKTERISVTHSGINEGENKLR